MAARGTVFKSPEGGSSAISIGKAIKLFEEHVKAHSPTKPATLHYHQILDHFRQILGKKEIH